MMKPLAESRTSVSLEQGKAVESTYGDHGAGCGRGRERNTFVITSAKIREKVP